MSGNKYCLHRKGLGQMKRFITLLVAILLIAGSLAFLPGCGGDTAKAQEYMKAGDDILSEVQTESESLGEQITDIGNDLSSGAITTTAELEERAEEYENDTDAILEKAEEAKAEYEKILSLNGVEDYVEYAGLTIDLIDTAIELLEGMNSMLTDTLAYLQKVEAGTLTEAEDAAFAEEMEKLEADIGDLSDEAEELSDEKDQLKTDKNL